MPFDSNEPRDKNGRWSAEGYKAGLIAEHKSKNRKSTAAGVALGAGLAGLGVATRTPGLAVIGGVVAAGNLASGLLNRNLTHIVERGGNQITLDQHVAKMKKHITKLHRD